MKVLEAFPVALVLWFANQLVDSKLTCKEDRFIVVINGTESHCLPCNHCPVGQGLSPPCGSKVNHPPPIDCVPCVPGKTFSDGHDPSTCKNCHLCSANEIVTRNCTVSDNTICSNTCKEGYYFENYTLDCHQCSDCCDKDSDIRIKECQNMPSNKQCSVDSARKCKPKPTDAAVVTGTTYPISTLSTTVPMKKPGTRVIVASITGAVVAVLLILVLIFYMRRKKSKRKDSKRSSNNHNARYNARMMEDGAHNKLIITDNDHCDLHHKLPFDITNKSPNPLSEGQSILLLLTCDNQNGDVKGSNRKCNFGYEWKKDGDSISKNNYQNYSNDLTIDDVDVADSGRYYCDIHCNGHPNHKENSHAVEIRIQPVEGRELKLLSDLEWDVEDKVVNWLTPKTVGIGNWMDLGRIYGIDEDALKALDKDPAAKVLENIKCNHPNLTVFDFCEVLKSDAMKQKKIVKFLKNELTKSIKDTAKPGNIITKRPDSGISDGFDFDRRQQVILPPDVPKKAADLSKLSSLAINPALLNPSFADSSREPSRESSREDLPASFLASVQNAKHMDDQVSKGSKQRFLRRKKSGDLQVKADESDSSEDDINQDQKSEGKKSRFGRQISKESQKSNDTEDNGPPRERKRSRSSSISSVFKEKILKQLPPLEYSALEHHHEESDENV